MSSLAANTSLPNPYTPMAFLPEDSALKVTIQLYAAVGSLGALIWDIIIHLPQDFRLATQHKINFPFIVYCISRLSTLTYLLAFVVVTTAPIGDCSMVQKISFIYTVAIPSTLLLFVFRVCALYHNRKLAVAFFSSLWLGLLACSIIMPFGISAYKVPVQGYCIEIKSNLAYGLVDLAPFVHDTVIFIATSLSFISNSYRELTLENGLRVLIFGKFLPAFSRSILRDGQLYYMSILVLNIGVIIVYNLRVPWLSSCTLGLPLFVLTNTLAAHIYRSIRLRVHMDYTLTSFAVDKNLGMEASGTTSTGIPGSPSNPNSNNPHVSHITFKRSITTTTTGTGSGLHSIEVNSIQGDAGVQDPEKQGDGD